MGDPRKLKPKYEPPKKLWSTERITEEKKLVEEYGLRSMHELWVMQRELKRVRREARKYLSAGEKGKAEGVIIINKCLRLGYAKEGVTLDSLLALGIRDVLERRLETRVVKRGLAKSMKQSRQLIAHGFIAVNGRKMNSPSYIVPVSEEQSITYFKPINLETPVMAQRSARAKEAETPEAEPQAAAEAAPEDKPAEAAS